MHIEKVCQQKSGFVVSKNVFFVFLAFTDESKGGKNTIVYRSTLVHTLKRILKFMSLACFMTFMQSSICC